MSSVVNETSLITEYNKYFSEVEPKNDFLFNIQLDNYTSYSSYTTNIENYIKLLKDIYSLRGLTFNDNLLSFYQKSLLIHSLRNTLDSIDTESKITNINILEKTSGNCLHTILTYKDLYYFVKMVTYENEDNKDLVIFDIINGIYFNYLPEFKNFISIYICSFLSYYLYNYLYDDNLWDYNKLCYISNNDYSKTPSDGIYSPYNPNSNNKDFNKLLNNYSLTSNYKRSIILIFKAIHHITLSKLFSDIDSNEIIIESIFTEKFLNFFKTLIKLGISQGFHHNDLHRSNIIYNYDINELVIIDFGRSCFAKLLHEENDYINNALLIEIDKLNYKFINITTYKDLYNEQNNLLKYHDYVEELEYKSKNIYPMIIFDHISLTLTIYKYLITYFNYLNEKYEYNNDIKEFIDIFTNIFKYTDDYKTNFIVNSNQLNIDILMKCYNDINTYLKNLESANSLYKYKTTFKILLDGLLLVGILLIKLGYTYREDDAIIGDNNCVFLTLDQKNEFIGNLITIYQSNIKLFVDNKHFLNYILSANTEGINFDLKPYTVPLSEPLVEGGKKQKKINMLKAGNQELNHNMEKLKNCYKDTYKEIEEIEEIKLLSYKEKGGKKKIVNRKIRRLKKYN